MNMKSYLESKGFKLNHYLPEDKYFWEHITTEDLLDDDCVIFQTTENFDRFVISRSGWVDEVDRNKFINSVENEL